MTAGRKLRGEYILPLFSHHISVAIVINPQLKGSLCIFLFSKTLSKLKLKTCSWLGKKKKEKKESIYSTGTVQVLVTNTFPHIKKCKLGLMWDFISFFNYLVCPAPIFCLFCEASQAFSKVFPMLQPPTPRFLLKKYYTNSAL